MKTCAINLKVHNIKNGRQRLMNVLEGASTEMLEEMTNS